jgi:citrate lyase beta subunit
MSTHPRGPRRTLLFMPGDDRYKIEKGAGLASDCLIMDLEDGVAFNQKELARQTIRQALEEVRFSAERIVRINPVGSGLEMDDLAATLPGQPDAIMLPKVESAEQVAQIAQYLTAQEQERAWEIGDIHLIALIESALGVANVHEIARSSSRLVGLMFGAEDLMGSMGGLRTGGMTEAMYGRQAVVLHAKAYGLQAYDTPYTDLQNPEGLLNEAQTARQWGYDGKAAIHPKQLGPIMGAFTPDEAAIKRARILLEAFQDHQREGRGVFTYEGKMIEMPMIRAARDTLRRAGLDAGEVGT